MSTAAIVSENPSSVANLSPDKSPHTPVALVYMPWGEVGRGAIAVSILKRCLKQRGFECDIHHLNIRFAEQIGLDLYNRISTCPSFITEWFFSSLLFGKRGLGLIDNRWTELSTPAGQRLKEQLAGVLDGADVSGEFIAEEAVPRFIAGCLDNIDWSRYSVVGFSTTFAQTTASLLMAKAIHDRNPGLKIVFGGANADAEMGFELLKGFEWIDYVVHGEAERSFPQLVTNIMAEGKCDPISGISMRDGGTLIAGYQNAQPVTDLNESPAPDYSEYLQEMQRTGFQKKTRISLSFESSRGCWWGAKHHCTFCGLNGSTMAFRKKTPERVFDEIMEISRKNRCLNLSAVDNILALDYFTHLLPRLAETNIDFTLFYEVKANLTRQQVKMLRDAGITTIQPGIESLNTRILRLMRKGVSAIQNIQLLKWCYEFGIQPLWNVLYGFPGETPQDYEQFPRVFRLISHLYPPGDVTPVVFERFSPYHFDRDKFALQLRPAEFYNLIFPESRIDMARFAYYFSGDWEGRQGSPNEYVQPMRQAAGEWQRSWKEKRVFCYYEKGQDFVSIYDSRPLTQSPDPVGRKTVLNQLQAEAFLFCDEHRSFKSIHERLSTHIRTNLKPEESRVLLEQLVNAGFLFQEEDRFLALAVRKKSAGHHAA